MPLSMGVSNRCRFRCSLVQRGEQNEATSGHSSIKGGTKAVGLDVSFLVTDTYVRSLLAPVKPWRPGAQCRGVIGANVCQKMTYAYWAPIRSPVMLECRQIMHILAST